MFLCLHIALNSACLLLGAVRIAPAPLGQSRLVVGIVMRLTIPWRCTDQRGVNSKTIPSLRHIHRFTGLSWAYMSLTRCTSIGGQCHAGLFQVEFSGERHEFKDCGVGRHTLTPFTFLSFIAERGYVLFAFLEQLELSCSCVLPSCNNVGGSCSNSMPNG